MNKRKLLIGLLTAGIFSAGFGAAVFPASAELRTLTVTLLGGQTVQVQVDVPPGTPLDQIQIPGVQGPIIGVSEANPPAPATSPVEVNPAPQPDPAQQQAPATTDQAAPTSSAPASTTPATTTTTESSKSRPERERSKTTKLDTTAVIEGNLGTSAADEKRDTPAPARDLGGAPTPSNPTFSFALPGPAPVGVPNFFIEKFRIPPFLLPIYQAAGIEYGVRWEVLAAINEIETDYGRNLNVSTAGAVGWMQFIPSTWKMYGVDANKDGRKDPYNPVDAIFSAARYLKAAGYGKDIRRAVFAYNHAGWYVDSVLLRARLIGGASPDLVVSLTGLT